MNGINDIIIKSWRRREAYMVPLTKEGCEKAGERLQEFAVGFRYGVRAAAFMLERMHSENKKDHSFFLKASRAVLKLLEEKNETSCNENR